MQLLRTAEAAGILAVTAKTLHNWESRYGFPQPMRTEGRHRLYRREEILALRHELAEQNSIGEAIACAQAHVEATGSSSLMQALESLDEDGADRVMEAALGLMPVDRIVEELLLPSMRSLADRRGRRSAELAFALGWAIDWLRRAGRMTLLPASFSALIVNACGSPLDPNRVWTAALVLALRRRGGSVIELPVGAKLRRDLVRSRDLRVSVVCGDAADDAADEALTPVRLFYRRPRSKTEPITTLPAAPSAAADTIAARAILRSSDADAS